MHDAVHDVTTDVKSECQDGQLCRSCGVGLVLPQHRRFVTRPREKTVLHVCMTPVRAPSGTRSCILSDAAPSSFDLTFRAGFVLIRHGRPILVT